MRLCQEKKKNPIRINTSDLNRLLKTAKTTKHTLNPSSDPLCGGVVQQSGDVGGRSLGPQVAERSGKSDLPSSKQPANFPGEGKVLLQRKSRKTSWKTGVGSFQEAETSTRYTTRIRRYQNHTGNPGDTMRSPADKLETSQWFRPPEPGLVR